MERKPFPHQPVSPCPWICQPSPSNSASLSPLSPSVPKPGSIPTDCPACLSFPAYRLQVPNQANAKYLDPAVSTGLILSPKHFHSSASIYRNFLLLPSCPGLPRKLRKLEHCHSLCKTFPPLRHRLPAGN